MGFFGGFEEIGNNAGVVLSGDKDKVHAFNQYMVEVEDLLKRERTGAGASGNEDETYAEMAGGGGANGDMFASNIGEEGRQQENFRRIRESAQSALDVHFGALPVRAQQILMRTMNVPVSEAIQIGLAPSTDDVVRK